MSPVSLNAPNELMLSHVWRYLPTPCHNAYVCYSGTKGYCALKDTLQNGIPGRTLLIESKDLRDVDSGEEQCCLVYIPRMDEHKYKDHIPPTVAHVTVYGNVSFIPPCLLDGCPDLTSVDLRPLAQVTVIMEDFLAECTGLTSVDLSPLSQVTVLQEYFFRCAGLTSIDLSPLSQVTEVRGGFLAGCTGLTSLDLSSLSQVTVVYRDFLRGCTGLTSVDLSPLSQVTDVREGFLRGCTGLTSVDLSPMLRARELRGHFLGGCPQITIIDSVPPILAGPPYGWMLKEGKWVRE